MPLILPPERFYTTKTHFRHLLFKASGHRCRWMPMMFMTRVRLGSFGEQIKSLGEIYTKAAAEVLNAPLTKIA